MFYTFLQLQVKLTFLPHSFRVQRKPAEIHRFSSVFQPILVASFIIVGHDRSSKSKKWLFPAFSSLPPAVQALGRIKPSFYSSHRFRHESLNFLVRKESNGWLSSIVVAGKYQSVVRMDSGAFKTSSLIICHRQFSIKEYAPFRMAMLWSHVFCATRTYL